MVEDGTYQEYRSRLDDKLSEPIETFRWEPPAKYKRICAGSEASWVPVSFSGCTVLAVPYPLRPTGHLAEIQNRLCAVSRAFAAVPAETFHVTVADLLAGPAYERLTEDSRKAVLNRTRDITSAWQLAPPLLGRTCGLATFPGVVVVVVDFPDSSAYEQLVELRNSLYRDQVLVASGVQRQFPFIAHITLGYVESPVPGNHLSEELARVRHGLHPFEIEIHGACPFVFPHMSEYATA